MIILYVDDYCVLTNNEAERASLEFELGKVYKLKLLGDAKLVLGTVIDQDLKNGMISFHQTNYLENVGQKFKQTDAKIQNVPMDPGLKLLKPQTKSEVKKHYQSLLGSLMYPTNMYRFDLTYAISRLSQYSSEHDDKHWKALQRVARYAYHTRDFKLTYVRVGNLLLDVFIDASYINDKAKSTTGYVIRLGGKPIIWRTLKQKTVALSSAEA